jgi:hypothetical protein
VRFITFPHALVTAFNVERIGKFASRGMGEHALFHLSPVSGIGILAVKGGDADFTFGHKVCVHEFRDVQNAFHPARSMGERNKAVRLAAAVGSVETKDRSARTGIARKPTKNVPQQVLQPTRGVSLSEKARGLAVVGRGIASDNFGQICREVRFGDGAIEHILARGARIKNGRKTHAQVAKITIITTQFKTSRVKIRDHPFYLSSYRSGWLGQGQLQIDLLH